MSRLTDERFRDILAAIARCEDYRGHLVAPDPEIAQMAYDAVLRNLAVIGEAVRALPEEARASIPDIPWKSIAGPRNIVVHEYFRVDPELVADIVENQLEPLARAIRKMLGG